MMPRCRLWLPCLMSALSFFSYTSAEAGISVIITTPPPLQEIVVEPVGYSRCYSVPAGFYQGIWHYEHRLCEYDEDSGVWVAGYWQCGRVAPGGRCMRTVWVRSHWAVPEDREYEISWDRQRHYHNPHAYGYAHGNYRSNRRYENEHGHAYAQGHGPRYEHGNTNGNAPYGQGPGSHENHHQLHGHH